MRYNHLRWCGVVANSLDSTEEQKNMMDRAVMGKLRITNAEGLHHSAHLRPLIFGDFGSN